jgi:general secretion pathway protein G
MRSNKPCTSVYTRGRGFTLLELMVVMLILALISGIAAPRVVKYLNQAKLQTATIQVDALGAAVESFYLDTGRYPTDDEGLTALVEAPTGLVTWNGPYVRKRDSLLDPWGKPYIYRFPGEHGDFDILTLAADGQTGGEGNGTDIGNW